MKQHERINNYENKIQEINKYKKAIEIYLVG